MSRPASLVPLQRPRVLLLEDTAEEAEAIVGWLRAPSPDRFEVVHVRTVAEVVDRLRSEDWDVVLLDLCVPDSRGLDTFHTAQAAAGDVPIVVQSGIALESVALKAVAEGAQDYLVKRSMGADLVRRSLRYAIERGRAESELRRSRERYRLAMMGANDGVWDWDILAGRLFLSDRWCAQLGYAAEDVGTDFEDWLGLIHPRDRDGFLVALEAHLEGTVPHFEVEHRILHRDGSWRWMRTRGLAVRDARGEATRMAGSQMDVTERRRGEEQLLHQAQHDALTELPNRSLFMDRLGHLVARCQRGDVRGCAVLFLDLDRFKIVNDSMGHRIGDELLVEIGRRLRDCVRPGDLVARLGGDEFGVLIEEGRGPGMAEELATRIHRAVRAPVVVDGQEVYTSASVGIARRAGAGPGPSEGADTDAADLLRNADIAMYRAKKAGRACSEVFDEALHSWAVGRLAVESGLRRAIERDEFLLHYQPIVRLGDAGLVGFEALARWESPERGLVRPDEFIPVAEETGLILDVGRLVLRRACRQVAELNALLSESRAVDVSVNVSSRQLTQSDFPEIVGAALVDSGLPADRLVLELTETALMENPGRAVEILEELRSGGVRVHLDDFGAGYSSLSYLRRFPIDRIKIDRAFVMGMPEQREDEAIVRAILGLAEALEMEVIAEGIETDQQWSFLRQLNCAYGQGYHFARPLELARARDLARAGRFADLPLPGPGFSQPRPAAGA